MKKKDIKEQLSTMWDILKVHNNRVNTLRSDINDELNSQHRVNNSTDDKLHMVHVRIDDVYQRLNQLDEAMGDVKAWYQSVVDNDKEPVHDHRPQTSTTYALAQLIGNGDIDFQQEAFSILHQLSEQDVATLRILIERRIRQE